MTDYKRYSPLFSFPGCSVWGKKVKEGKKKRGGAPSALARIGVSAAGAAGLLAQIIDLGEGIREEGEHFVGKISQMVRELLTRPFPLPVFKACRNCPQERKKKGKRTDTDIQVIKQTSTSLNSTGRGKEGKKGKKRFSQRRKGRKDTSTSSSPGAPLVPCTYSGGLAKKKRGRSLITGFCCCRERGKKSMGVFSRPVHDNMVGERETGAVCCFLMVIGFFSNRMGGLEERGGGEGGELFLLGRGGGGKEKRRRGWY